MQAALSGGQTINASYQFEVVASLRGVQWQITRREARENSAIFRTYDNLFPGKPGFLRTPDRGASPRLMHQLAVTGKRAADVAVLLGGQDLQVHRIERDDALISQLVQLEQQFWGYVVRDEAPRLRHLSHFCTSSARNGTPMSRQIVGWQVNSSTW